MRLTFLGTRGNVAVASPLHALHSSLLVSHRGRAVMVDCGEDWLERLDALSPDAIILTHAHPDHAFGLRRGAPCPVHATAETWDALAAFPVPASQRRVLAARTPVVIAGIGFEAFPVEHSIRAPAVGYRIAAGRGALFYAPDLVAVIDRHEALSGAQLYIGDGATVERSLVRRERGGTRLVGHAPIRTQIGWCAAEGVGRMLVTHCGSQIVRADPDEIAERVRALGRERGVEVEIACDGLQVLVR